jgi:hypothetical protein
MKVIPTVLATLVVALGMSAAFAQSGGMTVRVTDSAGPLPGATVTISQETGYIKTTSFLTNKDGIVEFPVLKPGQGYQIEVSFPGFGTRRVGDLRVAINDRQTITVQLAEEIQERVKVTAEGEVVDLEKVTNSAKFSDEFIQDLPVPGRFYQNVLTLAPGVQDADGDGNPNVHGSRNRDFKAVVSGISNVDPLTGQQGMQINPNSIEEMEVITAGAGVEFSRAQGGFARIIQKQGSNEFEGVFEFYYRTSKLDGDGAGNDSNLPDQDFEWLQPAFQLSGPIVKDKLWYRLSHEFYNNEVPINVGSFGTIVQTQELGVHSDQLTWQVSPRNKLAFQFQSDPLDIDNFGVNSLTPSESARRLMNTGETWSLTWTAPYSPKVLVESRVAWQDLNLGIFPNSQGALNTCISPDEPELGFLATAHCFDSQAATFSGSHFQTWDDHAQRLTVGGDATIYGGRFWGMNHQIRTGVVVENERYFRSLERRPNMSIIEFKSSDDQSGDNTAERRALIPVTLAVPETDEVRATGVTWGLYAEDQMKPRQNLTLTLGLRVDREELDSDGHETIDFEAQSQEFLRLTGELGIEEAKAWSEAFTAYEDIDDFVAQLAQRLGKPLQTLQQQLAHAALQSGGWPNKRRKDDLTISNTNWSPFLSVSWDPWSNGKTKFAATARRYYDKIFLAIPLIELEPATTTIVYNATAQQGGGWKDIRLSSSINPAVNVSSVDRNLKTPHQDEFTFVFERELWAETSVGVTYINRQFRDQFQDIDLNYLPGDLGRCKTATTLSPQTVVPLVPGEPAYVEGGGDGIDPDDCAGKAKFLDVSTPGEEDDFGKFKLEEPDGRADLYLQNPGWGSVYLVGNFNEIDYEAFVVQLTRRQYRSWEMQASYTWSQAEGNGEDFQQLLGDDRSLLQDEAGFQSYDQRHVVKLSATTITPWGFRLGSNVSWQSGLPFSIIEERISFNQNQPSYGTLSSANSPQRRQLYPSGQRNDERNKPYWNVDVKFTKEMNLGRGLNMQISAEVFNLLNDGTTIVWAFRPPVAARSEAGLLIGRQRDPREAASPGGFSVAAVPAPPSPFRKLRDRPQARQRGAFRARMPVLPVTGAESRYTSHADLQYADAPDRKPGAPRAGPRSPLYLRPDCLRLRPHRKLPRLRVGGSAPARAEVSRLRGDAGDEHHRRRGQDHRQEHRRGPNGAGGDRARHRRFFRGHRHAPHRAGGALSPGDRAHRGDDRAGPAAAGKRADLHQPGLAVLQDQRFQRLRPAFQSGEPTDHQRRPRRQ